MSDLRRVGLRRCRHCGRLVVVSEHDCQPRARARRLAAEALAASAPTAELTLEQARNRLREIQAARAARQDDEGEDEF